MMDQQWRHIRRLVIFGFIAFLAVIATIGALALTFGIPRPFVGYYPYPFWGFGWLWALFGLFFLFWIGRWIFWGWGWGWHYPRRYWGYRDQSYYIIRERYARGEITKDQYDQMMRDLQQRE